MVGHALLGSRRGEGIGGVRVTEPSDSARNTLREGIRKARALRDANYRADATDFRIHPSAYRELRSVEQPGCWRFPGALQVGHQEPPVNSSAGEIQAHRLTPLASVRSLPKPQAFPSPSSYVQTQTGTSCQEEYSLCKRAPGRL